MESEVEKAFWKLNQADREVFLKKAHHLIERTYMSGDVFTAAIEIFEKTKGVMPVAAYNKDDYCITDEDLEKHNR